MARVRRRKGALLQATMFAVTLFLAFSPRPVLADSFGITSVARG
jgi:hypothetical protein